MFIGLRIKFSNKKRGVGSEPLIDFLHQILIPASCLSLCKKVQGATPHSPVRTTMVCNSSEWQERKEWAKADPGPAPTPPPPPFKKKKRKKKKKFHGNSRTSYTKDRCCTCTFYDYFILLSVGCKLHVALHGCKMGRWVLIIQQVREATRATLAGHITIHRQAWAGFKWVLCDNPNFGMVQQFDIPKLLQTGSKYF